jgi:hypothetical protein
VVEVADVSPRWISILRMLANVAAYMGGDTVKKSNWEKKLEGV